MATECESLHKQYDAQLANLNLIDERIAGYVAPNDVPLQLLKDRRGCETELARLRAEIERTCRAPSPPARRPAQPKRTLIVDPMYQEPDSYPTITAALAAAMPGERILIRAGTYEEHLTLTQDGLELIGAGDVEDVVIETSTSAVLTFAATSGLIKNITLRQIADPPIARAHGDHEAGWYPALEIAQGNPQISECVITSQSGACVLIHDRANPRLSSNIIEGGQCGVLFHSGGRGRLDDNQIRNHAGDGVVLSTRAAPTLRYNRIYGNGLAGVVFVEHGRGSLHNNDIYQNAADGVQILQSSNPTVRENRIYGNQGHGVLINAAGQGTLEANVIFANEQAGMLVRAGSTPTVRENQINRNHAEAIRIEAKGGGTYTHNDLRENGGGAWRVDRSSKPLIKREKNRRT
ncbi:MAG: hypothetical protein HC911_13380 [Chloroflexaceae bacterium]|nr:hypothetical protein [Chloroflexaceae bacterium]